MTHLPQSNLYAVCTGIEPSTYYNDTGITLNSRFHRSVSSEMGLDLSVGGNNITNVTAQLINIDAELKDFAHESELSFINEELQLTKLQKKMLQLKYDLLQDTNENLITKNKAISDQLDAYTCSICLTNSKDCILEPCGHFVCCIQCISMLPNAQCPVCRTKCNYYIKVFNS